MKKISLAVATGGILLACLALAQPPSTGPYKVVKTAKTGGDGGFDNIYADNDGGSCIFRVLSLVLRESRF